jgi:hypothetical protein
MWNEEPRMSSHQRIGEILIAKGLITEAQLREALQERGESYFRVGEVLAAKGWIREDDIVDALAEQTHLPVVDLDRTYPDPEAVELLGLGYCYARLVLPILQRNGHVICAVADPLDNLLLEAFEEAKGLHVEIVLARPSALRAAIQRLIGKTTTKAP